MKVRNLLLAGLVAVGMSACSNEVENGSVDNLAKDAKMQLVISLPTATGTRTDATTTPGELYEQKINNLTVVVVNGSSIVVQYYPEEKLVKGEGVYSDIKNTTPAFDVTSGENVTVYAYANYGAGVIDAKNYTNYTITGSYSEGGKNGLTLVGDVANIDKSNFYMSGSEPGVTIVAGKTDNKAIVKINRVVAKITEKTTNKEFPTTLARAPKIKLTAYTLYNLGTSTGILTDPSTTEVYKRHEGISNPNCFPIWVDEQTSSNQMTDKEQTTYCLANKNHDATLNTHIAYRAKITYPKGVADLDGTFYVRKNPISGQMEVHSLKSLQSNYEGTYDNFDAKTSIKTWFENGVLKYNEGVSYYQKELTTNNVAEIVRNNVYQVTVKNINGLGAPELDMPEVGDPTMLTVAVEVQPWTIQLNDIDLK